MTSVIAAAILACTPTPTNLAKAIERMSWAPKSTRAARAERLAKRILIESKRHNLNPIALTAVGSVESDFRPRVKGPGFKPRGYAGRMFEYGTFQLIPNSAPVKHAARKLAKLCPVIQYTPVGVLRHPTCPVEVVKARKRVGHFNTAELEDYTIGTWVAATEIRMHLDGCLLRHKRGHGWRHAYYIKRWAKRYGLTVAEVSKLDRWAHYNSGPTKKTLLRYTSKLVQRYSKIKRLACKGVSPNATDI